MTEAERIKLTILLHQYTPAERLSAMEIATVLQFMEQRDYTINRKACCDFTSTTETETAGTGHRNPQGEKPNG